MSQALYCGCRPDSLIREECCPWHPEFSTEITHSSSLFPALRSSSQLEQTRRGNPLSPSPSPPSSYCARPLPHHMLFSHPFHHFFFLLHHLGSVNVGYWSSLFSFSLLDLASLVVEWHKDVTHKVSQTNLGLLLRKWWWIRMRGVFLGLVQDTHMQLSKKKKQLWFTEISK